MFARAVTAPRHILLLAAVLVGLAGCGKPRQDADEPEGSFRMDVVQASFPARQHIADQATMRIRVRNTSDKAAPVVAVTVQTRGKTPGSGVSAFGQRANDSRLADPNRPVWVLDREPVGGTSAYTDTWTLGPLAAGQEKTFEWKVTPVEPGSYFLSYRVSPGLDEKAKLAQGSRARDAFRVTVSDRPVPARVDAKGNVVRGERAGAGKD